MENDENKELKIEVLFTKTINWKAGSKDWKCKEGYKKSGNKCFKVGVRPPTDYWVAGSKGWTCNEGYIKSGSKCIKAIIIPGVSCPTDTPGCDMRSKGWTCNEGYKKSGNKCLKVEEMLRQAAIEREIAVFEAELAAELGQ